MTTATYTVEGVTCGYCIAEVMERVRSLPGVTGLAVDLVAGGRSPLIVTSGSAMAVGVVREAVENAGFDLTNSERRGVRQRGHSSSTRVGETRSGSGGQMESSIGGVNS